MNPFLVDDEFETNPFYGAGSPQPPPRIQEMAAKAAQQRLQGGSTGDQTLDELGIGRDTPYPKQQEQPGAVKRFFTGYLDNMSRALSGRQSAAKEQADKSELELKQMQAQTQRMNAESIEMDRKFRQGLAEQKVDTVETPAEAIARRIREARQFNLSEEQTRMYALNGKLPEQKVDSSVSETELAIRAISPDPAVSGPAKAALAVIAKQSLAKRPVTINQLNAQDQRSAMDEVAADLASGTLTRLREVASMRSGERLLVYAKAKRINPNFSTSEIDRKIKMQEGFDVGKDADNLRSFGIFLEHAGDASDLVNAMRNSDSRYMNKPINWIRRNVSGDPVYQAFITSLEPVRKEFEGFLLGGRALYADDRKNAEIILDENSSPAQIQAALKQMAKTADKRLVESNYKYKRVMGVDLDEPVSPEARAAAEKMGVKLSVSGGSPAPIFATNPTTKARIVSLDGGKTWQPSKGQ